MIISLSTNSHDFFSGNSVVIDYLKNIFFIKSEISEDGSITNGVYIKK